MCIRFPQGERFRPLPTLSHPIVRPTTPGQCCLYVHSLSQPLSALTTASKVLHELRLIHTDLKPENILLVKNDFNIVQVPTPGKVRASSRPNYGLLLTCFHRYSAMPLQGRSGFSTPQTSASSISGPQPLRKSIIRASCPHVTTEHLRSSLVCCPSPSRVGEAHKYRANRQGWVGHTLVMHSHWAASWWNFSPGLPFSKRMTTSNTWR